jgi:hypothetical protein
MIVHWENQGINFYKFKAKDIDLLLPAMYDVKFEEIINNNVKTNENCD